MYPFKQSQKGDTIIREFASDVDSEELVWHRDRSDRYVKVLEGSGWYLQVDNQIPQKLIEGSVYFIPANNYHRVIRGKDSLIVSIKEHKMKITRRQLKRIIKEELAHSRAGGDSPVLVRYGDRSEIVYNSYELDDLLDSLGPSVPYSIDDLGDMEPRDMPIGRGIEQMAEERTRLMEYEQYVDEDGNVYDDEGNVTRRGKSFGRRYGGGTYGTRGLPPSRRSSSRRKTTFAGSAANAPLIAAVEAALSVKSNNFLQSILDQLKKGRGLSSKQKAIVKKILVKTDPEAAKLFEVRLSESAEMHRCMDGRMVKPESEACLVDIMDRIDDAEFHRNSHSCGSENRVYYNGLLKGLRTRRNALSKILQVD